MFWILSLLSQAKEPSPDVQACAYWLTKLGSIGEFEKAQQCILEKLQELGVRNAEDLMDINSQTIRGIQNRIQRDCEQRGGK